MGLFPSSFGYLYILVCVDYLSKWVEAFPTRTDDAKTVVKLRKTNILNRYGVPRAIISDKGTHFCNQTLKALCSQYGVTQKVSTAYHSQTNGQAESSNKEIKGILEKIVKPNRKRWSQRLDEALWAVRIAYKTPIGMSPYRVVFGKACHLPVELEHRSFCGVKQCNLDYSLAGEERKLKLHELEELSLEAYDNSVIYKANLKGQYVQGCITSLDPERLVERVHELNQGEEEEPTEPETKESTNKTKTEVDSVTDTEEKESDKEPNSPQPAEGVENPEPRVEPEEEPVKPYVEPEYTTPMPTSAIKGMKNLGMNVNVLDGCIVMPLRAYW
ncbi:uncharacterized protein LOC105795833 [Gossypium raimondii]|uniref:uncharacterized protein LOC105795833 n=1 Tax=Gossypium raimondii TaxID=29730 RepID=UPI00063AA160|nr:uncharacterized protein LOC105795833 [Gossypium raimondii]